MESMDDPKYTAAKARTGASIRGTPSTFFSPSPYQSVILFLSLFFFSAISLLRRVSGGAT